MLRYVRYENDYEAGSLAHENTSVNLMKIPDRSHESARGKKKKK